MSFNSRNFCFLEFSQTKTPKVLLHFPKVDYFADDGVITQEIDINKYKNLKLSNFIHDTKNKKYLDPKNNFEKSVFMISKQYYILRAVDKKSAFMGIYIFFVAAKRPKAHKKKYICTETYCFWRCS